VPPTHRHHALQPQCHRHPEVEESKATDTQTPCCYSLSATDTETLPENLVVDLKGDPQVKCVEPSIYLELCLRFPEAEIKEIYIEGTNMDLVITGSNDKEQIEYTLFKQSQIDIIKNQAAISFYKGK
jgi:hypothetical protein